MPWPSLYCVRPTLKSSTFSPPPMLVPERQPMYASSTPNDAASLPTRSGAELNVPSPTALSLPYHSEPPEFLYTPPRPALTVPSVQLSPRSPDGSSGRGLRYSELSKPKTPYVASRLNVQSTPAGNPGGGVGLASSSATAGAAASASNTAADILLRVVMGNIAKLLS